MFPDEPTAARRFESRRWPGGIRCAHCRSERVSRVKSGKAMPFRPKDCRRHFSVRTGSFMAQSPIPLRKWASALSLCATDAKGVSSMTLRRRDAEAIVSARAARTIGRHPACARPVSS